jgi:hypothetical protein
MADKYEGDSMTTQYSYNELYSTPESEYHADELKKRLHGSLANFAQIRFKRAMRLRMALLENQD